MCIPHPACIPTFCRTCKLAGRCELAVSDPHQPTKHKYTTGIFPSTDLSPADGRVQYTRTIPSRRIQEQRLLSPLQQGIQTRRPTPFDSPSRTQYIMRAYSSHRRSKLLFNRKQQQPTSSDAFPESRVDCYTCHNSTITLLQNYPPPTVSDHLRPQLPGNDMIQCRPEQIHFLTSRPLAKTGATPRAGAGPHPTQVQFQPAVSRAISTPHVAGCSLQDQWGHRMPQDAVAQDRHPAKPLLLVVIQSPSPILLGPPHDARIGKIASGPLRR